MSSSPSFQTRRRGTMRWTLFIIIVLVILLAGYTVWPFYGLYRIASAVETRNSALRCRNWSIFHPCAVRWLARLQMLI
jgi:hypothetical protein